MVATKKKSTVNAAGNYTKYLIKLKQEVKVVNLVSGQHVKHRCWLNNIKLKVEVINLNGIS